MKSETSSVRHKITSPVLNLSELAGCQKPHLEVFPADPVQGRKPEREAKEPRDGPREQVDEVALAPVKELVDEAGRNGRSSLLTRKRRDMEGVFHTRICSRDKCFRSGYDRLLRSFELLRKDLRAQRSAGILTEKTA